MLCTFVVRLMGVCASWLGLRMGYFEKQRTHVYFVRTHLLADAHFADSVDSTRSRHQLTCNELYVHAYIPRYSLLTALAASDLCGQRGKRPSSRSSDALAE